MQRTIQISFSVEENRKYSVVHWKIVLKYYILNLRKSHDVIAITMITYQIKKTSR